MGLVQDLEALRHGHAIRGQRAALGGLRDEGRVVAQRFQEPAHAVLAVAGAQQHGRDLVGAELVVQVTVDQRLLGRDVLDQLLEQRVIEL